jgi:hypothetical protein
METSLLKTLAAKHNSSVTKTAARYKAKIETPHGLRTCFEAVRRRENHQKPLVARFGGIPLTRRKTAVIDDRVPGRNPLARKELITRLLRNRCELCHHSGQVQVHHVAKLADLAPPAPANRHGPQPWRQSDARPSWSARPAMTTSTPNGHQPQTRHRSLESRMPGNWHVRFGGGP